MNEKLDRYIDGLCQIDTENMWDWLDNILTKLSLNPSTSEPDIISNTTIMVITAAYYIKQ